MATTIPCHVRKAPTCLFLVAVPSGEGYVSPRLTLLLVVGRHGWVDACH